MKLKPKSTTLNTRALLYKRFIGLEKSENLQTIYKTLADNKYWTFDSEILTFSEIESTLIPKNATITNVENTLSILKFQNYYFRYYLFQWDKSLSVPFEFNTEEMTLAQYNTSGFLKDFYLDLVYFSAPKITITNNGNLPINIEVQVKITSNTTTATQFWRVPAGYATISAGETLTFNTSLSSGQSDSQTRLIFFNSSGTQDYVGNVVVKFEYGDLNDFSVNLAQFNNIAKYQANRYYFAGSFDFMIKGSIEGTTTQYLKGNIVPLTSLNIKHFNDDLKISVDDLVVVDKRLYSVENPETVQKRQPKPFNVHFATLNSVL